MPLPTDQQEPQQVQAQNPAEAFWTFNPFALVQPGDPWYCDLESHLDKLHYGVQGQLGRRLLPSLSGPKFVQVGLVGHGGTGKTTLVRRVAADLKNGMATVFVDATATLDRADFRFAEVLLVIVEAVVNGLEAADTRIPDHEAELVRSWFSEELLSATHRKQILGSVETEAAAGGGIPLIAKLAAKITAQLKSDNEYRLEIRRRAERDPEDLIRRVNMLLDAATKALKTPRLVVVLDNLEKIEDREMVDRAVLRRADELSRLRCHLVLFLAPADQYAPVTIQASQAFDVVYLPVLPIREKGDGPDHLDPKALGAVRDLLERRADLAKVFDDSDAAVQQIARCSGGRIRDIFHLARHACELADPDRVSIQHLRIAAQRLRGERVTAIRPGQWARLAQIHREKQVANDPANDGHLLLHSHVLSYDGEPWWDVHPLVRLDDRFEEEWKKLSPLAR